MQSVMVCKLCQRELFPNWEHSERLLETDHQSQGYAFANGRFYRLFRTGAIGGRPYGVNRLEDETIFPSKASAAHSPIEIGHLSTGMSAWILNVGQPE